MPRHRKRKPRLLLESLAWSVFAALVAAGVVLWSGAPWWQALLVLLGGPLVALAAYGLQRSGLMQVTHLEQEAARGEDTSKGGDRTTP